MISGPLTFTYDDLFTIATDAKGRTYRVLLACGGDGANACHYYLKPWQSGGGIPRYRGRYIAASDPLKPAIDEAERARRERPRPELTAAQRARFESEFA